MHVAQFIHRYPPALGGAESYFERLTRYLQERRDDVTVWTSTAIELNEMWTGNRTANRDEFIAGIRRYSPLTFPGRRYLLKAASLVPVPEWQALTLPCNPVCPAMWRDVGRFDGPLNVVHATAFPYSFPIRCGLRLARRRRVPFLLTPFLHLGDPDDPDDRTRRQYTSRPLQWLLTQADRVFVQTPSEFRAVVDRGVSEDRVILQGLGVELGECTGGDREAVRRKWGVQPDEFVIGQLANLSIEKGTRDLLRATGPAGRVVLAGPAMPNFEWFWSGFVEKHRVTRLGRISDSEKRDFFAGIDLFALPSRTDSFGLVLLEAWANGKPVIVYRAGGPADLVRDGVDGSLVKCGDVDALRARLEHLGTDENLRARMGEAGRERVLREFRWKEKLKLVRDVMLEVAGLASRERQ